MKPERPKKQTEEGRWRKVRRDRDTRLTCWDFTLGEQVPILSKDRKGFETRGLATIIDINPKAGWRSEGRIYVRVPALDDHVYELDFSRSTSYCWGQREVHLDEAPPSG